MAVDVSNTVQAANTHEKLLCHEIALAQKVPMEQAARAESEHDPAIEMRRPSLAARMMASAQQAMLTLQQLRSRAPQSGFVQHVHVESSAQAVVGNIQTGD